MKKNLYEVLGVLKEATALEIKKSYKELMKKYHPDRLHSATEKDKRYAQIRFEEVQNAYEVLSDVKRREKYDNEIGGKSKEKFQKEEKFSKSKIDDLFGNYFNFECSKKNNKESSGELNKDVDNLFRNYFGINKGKNK